MVHKGRHNALTDVEGLAVGQYTNQPAACGVSVVICEEGAVAGVDVRGGAPCTRETDLLAPGNLVEKVQAIVLTGGSVFGDCLRWSLFSCGLQGVPMLSIVRLWRS